MSLGHCRDQAAALAEETMVRAARAAATTARAAAVATSSMATLEHLTTTEACQSLRTSKNQLQTSDNSATSNCRAYIDDDESSNTLICFYSARLLCSVLIVKRIQHVCRTATALT